MAYTNTIHDNQHQYQYDFSSGYSPELMEQLVPAALLVGNRTLSAIQKDIYRTLMTKACEEIRGKVAEIRIQSAKYPYRQELIEFLLKRLEKFAGRRHRIPVLSYHHVVNDVVYHLELTHKLQRIDWKDHELIAFSPVDELLIYMNYNSKTYIKMLESWLKQCIEASDNPIEELRKLHFYRKELAQLHRKPDIALHHDYLPVFDVMNNWFVHETDYLESKLELWTKAKAAETDNAEIKEKERIRWSLSSDQIALMLRAADDTRVILAKSMNAVFKTVVPHISSQHTDELSASAVRSRSYHAEQTDKEAVITALQKMIKRIEEY